MKSSRIHKDLSYNKFGHSLVEVTALKNLPRSRTAILETKIFEDRKFIQLKNYRDFYPSCQSVIKLESSTRHCSHTFLWLTKSTKNICSEASTERRADHFSGLNESNPYLFGKQHHNRLKIGTKIYVLEGRFKGSHRIIVGHKQGFNLFNEDKDPILQVLLVDLAGRYEVYNISQWIIKLVDLHNILGFGIPVLSSDDHLPRQLTLGTNNSSKRFRKE